MRDHLGTILVRFGIGRSRYRVEPGLYRLGEPGPDSEVFATANYKLSLDHLRSSLSGMDAWILVLDTKGINVWCAAGKGTFGTEELAGKIEECGLSGIVTHGRIILPQLGAPGVAAHEVKRRTGFTVLYGPVRARDIPRYLEAGRKAGAAMRGVTFNLAERIAVMPVEFTRSLIYAIPAAAIIYLLLPEAFLPVLAAYIAGILLFPPLLPVLPFRAFAANGAMLGAIASAAALILRPAPPLEGMGLLFIGAALASFLAMNFTGCTTFTSPSGVKREVAGWLPLQELLVFAGLGLTVTSIIISL